MKKIFLSFCLVTISSLVYADNSPKTATPPKEVFTLKYDESQKNQDLPLKNEKMTTKIFYYGNPMGFEDMTSNQDGQLSLDKYTNKAELIVEVLSFADQDKYKVKCHGSNKLGQSDIIVKCKNVNS